MSQILYIILYLKLVIYKQSKIEKNDVFISNITNIVI